MGSTRKLQWVIVYKKINQTSLCETENAVGWEGVSAIKIIQFVKLEKFLAKARLSARDVRHELNEINEWN